MSTERIPPAEYTLLLNRQYMHCLFIAAYFWKTSNFLPFKRTWGKKDHHFQAEIFLRRIFSWLAKERHEKVKEN